MIVYPVRLVGLMDFAIPIVICADPDGPDASNWRRSLGWDRKPVWGPTAPARTATLRLCPVSFAGRPVLCVTEPLDLYYYCLTRRDLHAWVAEWLA